MKSTYGARDIAQNWETEYANFINGGRNQARIAHAVRRERDIRVAVHGDVFTVLGMRGI